MNDPIFLLCSPRSGSTLLSRIVAGHENYLAVGETNFVKVLTSIREAEQMSGLASSTSDARDGSDEPLLLHDVGTARSIGNVFYRSLAVDQHIERVCDKSLLNAAGADLLAAVWPDSRFIALYRHCGDFIQSALSASPWGLDAFGFESYGASSPSNMVFALACFWIDHVERLLRIRSKLWSDRVTELRYEDVVLEPERTLEGLWKFLGKTEPSDLNQVFADKSQIQTPQDYKFRHSAGLNRASIGRGYRIPLYDLLPHQVLDSVNGYLSSLGYATISHDWGSIEERKEVLQRHSLINAELPRPGLKIEPTEPTNSWAAGRSPAGELKLGAPVPSPESHEELSEEAGLAELAETESDEQLVELAITQGGETLWVGEMLWRGGAMRKIASRVVDDRKIAGRLVLGFEAMFAMAVGHIEYGDAFRRGDFRYYSVDLEGHLRRAAEVNLAKGVGDFVIAAGEALLNGIQFDDALVGAIRDLGMAPS